MNSKTEIEKNLGLPVTEFAVPFGAFDSYVKDTIRTAGYTLAFNVDGANSDARADKMNINRIIARTSMSARYFTELATVPPIYFSANVPLDLCRVDTENTVMSFKIDGVQAFDETTVQSTVTSFSGLDLPAYLTPVAR